MGLLEEYPYASVYTPGDFGGDERAIPGIMLSDGARYMAEVYIRKDGNLCDGEKDEVTISLVCRLHQLHQ